MKPLTIRKVNKIDSEVDAAGKSDPRQREILLDRTSMNYKQAKFALVWHELGHYVLNKEQNDDTRLYYITEDWIPELPVSIMTTNNHLIHDELIEKYPDVREYYIQEMFLDN